MGIELGNDIRLGIKEVRERYDVFAAWRYFHNRMDHCSHCISYFLSLCWLPEMDQMNSDTKNGRRAMYVALTSAKVVLWNH